MEKIIAVGNKDLMVCPRCGQRISPDLARLLSIEMAREAMKVLKAKRVVAG